MGLDKRTHTNEDNERRLCRDDKHAARNHGSEGLLVVERALQLTARSRRLLSNKKPRAISASCMRTPVASPLRSLRDGSP